MRKYLQKPTQNCRTIFRKTLVSFLVSTFTFHFRNPFSKTKSKNQIQNPKPKSNTNIFGEWATEYFHTQFEKVLKIDP